MKRGALEHIICAAVYVDTGKAEPDRKSYSYPKTGIVFAGWRHADCFVALEAWAARLWFWERWAIDRIQEHQLRGRNQGFLTSTGRYVDRTTAAQIASAAGQIDRPLTSLTSEDLY